MTDEHDLKRIQEAQRSHELRSFLYVAAGSAIYFAGLLILACRGGR